MTLSWLQRLTPWIMGALLLLNSMLLGEQSAQAESQTPPPRTSPRRTPLPATTSTPLPDNKTQPGGTLNPAQRCPVELDSMTALVPTSNNPHPPRTQAQPFTLLVYVPNSGQRQFMAEVWINSRDQKTRVFAKQAFPLPTESKILAIQFPDSLRERLQMSRNYQWFFQLRCSDTDRQQLNGWLQPTADSTVDLWYDNLATQATRPDTTGWNRFLSTFPSETTTLQVQPELSGVSVELIELD